MNALWLPFLAVAVVFAGVAGLAAWWQQRRMVVDLNRRLDEAERSRREMAEHLLLMRQRLENQDVLSAGDLDERREALERALDLAAPMAEFPWLETLPGGAAATPAPAPDPDDRHFQPTQPSTQRLDLNLEESPGQR